MTIESSRSVFSICFILGVIYYAKIICTKESAESSLPPYDSILAGFWFLGLTYGIYMNVSGFSFWYPMLMSLTIFAGSMEFVAVNLLLGSFDPFQAFVMTLMINARHLFYGISMLDKYRGLGWKKFILCSACAMKAFPLTIPQRFRRMWTGAGSCFSSLF